MQESQTKYQALSRQEALAVEREVEEMKEAAFERGLKWGLKSAARKMSACGSDCSCNN